MCSRAFALCTKLHALGVCLFSLLNPAPLANIQLYAEIVKERRYETESERDEALDAVAGESRRLVEIVLDKALFGVLDQPEEESDHA